MLADFQRDRLSDEAARQALSAWRERAPKNGVCEEVDLTHNYLQRLSSEWFADFRGLRHLSVSQNPQLQPTRLCFDTLTTLMLEGCHLTALELDCPALKVLSVADNQLTELPAGLDKSKELSRLFASDNRLRSLPALWAELLPNIRMLALHNNPLWLLPVVDPDGLSKRLALLRLHNTPQAVFFGADFGPEPRDRYHYSNFIHILVHGQQAPFPKPTPITRACTSSARAGLSRLRLRYQAQLCCLALYGILRLRAHELGVRSGRVPRDVARLLAQWAWQLLKSDLQVAV